MEICNGLQKKNHDGMLKCRLRFLLNVYHLK